MQKKPITDKKYVVARESQYSKYGCAYDIITLRDTHYAKGSAFTVDNKKNVSQIGTNIHHCLGERMVVTGERNAFIHGVDEKGRVFLRYGVKTSRRIGLFRYLLS